jgi:hypothetical protein
LRPLINERIDDVNTLWRARENDVKPEPESYGKTEWIAADVLKSAEEQGIEITEEEANTLLQLCDENISERQIERGWDIINGEVEAYNRERDRQGHRVSGLRSRSRHRPPHWRDMRQLQKRHIDPKTRTRRQLEKCSITLKYTTQ